MPAVPIAAHDTSIKEKVFLQGPIFNSYTRADLWMCGTVAKRLRRRSRKPKIEGSNPSRALPLFFFFY